MTYRNDSGGGALIIYLAIIIVVVIIIYYAILLSLAIGALMGGGYAIYNYGRAFANNVKPRPKINGGQDHE